MPILELQVDGDPIAKGRPRSGKNGTTYTPRRTKVAEKVIKDAAVQQLGDDFAPVECAVGISVEFFCATMRRTDGDNLLKTVTDALNKTVYADDYLIVEYFARVHRGVGAERARTLIMVWELPSLHD